MERLEDRTVLNYAFSSTPFQWVELLNNGLNIPSAFGVTGTADDWANPVPLGSNTINFYGTTYSGPTGLWASSNGMLTFGSGNASFIPGDLLTNPGQAAISPLWMDLYDFDPNHLMISAEIDSVNNRLIIEWDHVHDFVTSNYITFEVIIQLNTGNTPGYIIFNYKQLDYFKGSNASIGIKDGGYVGPNLVVSLPGQTQSPLVNNQQAILFAWQLPGPTISSLSATSALEGSSDLFFTVNGNNFNSSSLVQANGIALATSFVSNTQLQATLPASLLAEEGSLSITVLNPGTSGISNAVPFNVIDAPLTPSGQFLSATEGQTLTGGLVATFTDAGSDGTAADYSATVTWDDGNGLSHTSSGTVKLLSGNTFGVYADNTVPYAEEGTHGVTVVISDKGGSQATVTSEVLVSDAALTPSSASISATENAAFSGPVATFNDGDPNAVVGDFTATINWGDGQTSTGSIATGPGGFVVSGSHTYADEGNYTVTVQIADAGGASSTVTSSAVVGDAALTAQGTSVSATEGGAFSGTVATFTDANASAPASDFTATINWGDGSSSSGTVTANGAGQFTVTGTHTYAEEGNFSVSVSIVDDGGASASASGSAGVADALLSASGTTVNPLEGVNFTGVVASFTDADPNGTATDYLATINWGDGTISSGTIQANAKGGFDVVGSHAYRNIGTTSIAVSIQDMGGSNNTATASSQAVVGDAPLTASGLIASATEGVAFSGAVASFTDLDAFAVPGNYVTTIDWGDGSASPGSVVVNPAGGFLVMGTHTYAEEGSTTIQVGVLDFGGSKASVSSTVNIGDASLNAAGMTIAATEGIAFSGPLATFTDANTGGTVSDFSATIAWGDGISTPGTVSANGGGSFTVSGSHIYAQEGTYSLTVTVTDVGGSPSAVANSTAQVADAALTASGSPVSSVEGSTFSGVVATFTDANANAPVSDFTALITWGDGHSSAGVINALGNGNFTVSGANGYAEEGSFPISVQITDVGGATATANTTANVADAALQAAGTTVNATEGSLFVGSVASFSDANLGNTAADFTVTISWGDGSNSTGSVVPLGNGQYAVRGSHTYADEGNYTVSVQITDAGGATASATSQAAVGDAALTTTAGSISSVEAGSFSGVVASFTDANPGAGLSDFSAMISWGDGTTSAGTISANSSGGFDVSGSHSYGIEGALAFSVTITDKGGSTITATGTANVADAPLSASGVSLNTTEALAFTGVVGSFTDANLLSTASDFKVIISWGDGSSSSGTVSQVASGSFNVGGSHTYADEGNYSVQVQIFDAGGASVVANSSVSVGDAPLTAGGSSVSAVEGAVFSGVVASFTDANANAPASDFTALITWGDGHSSAGVINALGNGKFTISGTNSYAEEGQYSVGVQIKDIGGATATATGTASVADAGLVVTGASLSSVEGSGFTGTVATFTDNNSGSTAADFTATVSWGDGSSSTGSVVPMGGGQYAVQGSHTYAEDGSYLVNVQIKDAGGSTGSASSQATVADASLSASGVSLTETQGAAFTDVVASFTDANSLSLVTDFVASISWGDGTSSNGTISPNGAGSFNVVGSHTYTLGGNFSIGVQITDVGGGASTTATSAVKVITVSLTATGTTVHAIEGQSFSAVVANFADGNSSLTAKDFSATIAWGDGTSSPGTIAPNGTGGFNVTGSHMYASEGSGTITVVIQDSAGASAQANSTLLIADGIPVVHATAHYHKHHHHVVLTGSFSDTALENHTLVVNWGDGTTTVTDLGFSSSGLFSLAHNYSGHFLAQHNGRVQITVTVLDNVGTSSAPQVLNLNFNEGHHHFHDDEGQHQGDQGDIWNIPGIDFFG